MPAKVLVKLRAGFVVTIGSICVRKKGPRRRLHECRATCLVECREGSVWEAYTLAPPQSPWKGVWARLGVDMPAKVPMKAPAPVEGILLTGMPTGMLEGGPHTVARQAAGKVCGLDSVDKCPEKSPRSRWQKCMADCLVEGPEGCAWQARARVAPKLLVKPRASRTGKISLGVPAKVRAKAWAQLKGSLLVRLPGAVCGELLRFGPHKRARKAPSTVS